MHLAPSYLVIEVLVGETADPILTIVFRDVLDFRAYIRRAGRGACPRLGDSKRVRVCRHYATRASVSLMNQRGVWLQRPQNPTDRKAMFNACRKERKTTAHQRRRIESVAYGKTKWHESTCCRADGLVQCSTIRFVRRLRFPMLSMRVVPT